MERERAVNVTQAVTRKGSQSKEGDVSDLRAEPTPVQTQGTGYFSYRVALFHLVYGV